MRRGLSTLVLVVVLVGLVAAVQLIQQVFAGRVTDLVARSVHGRTALGIATAALAEARERLCADLNRRGSAAFDLARRYPEPVAHPLSLTAADLPRTVARIQESYPGTFEIAQVAASLTARTCLTTATALEYDGDLAITVGVRSLLDRDVGRTLTRSWSFRVAGVAPADPLANVTVLIRAPDQVLTGRWNVPDLCRQFVDAELPEIVQDAKNLLTEIDREKAKPDAPTAQLDQLRGGYAPLVEGAGRVTGALARARLALQVLPPLPSEYMLGSAAPELPIGELRLQSDFEDLIAQHRQLKAQRDRLSEQVKASQDPGLHRSYADTVGQLAEVMEKCVQRWARFRSVFRVVPAGTPRHRGLAAAHDLLSPIGTLPGVPAYPRFDTRVSVVYDESRAAGALEDGLRRFLDALAGDGAFTGVVSVQNPTRPLRLTGAWRGRFTMVVTGSLALDGLTRNDPASDTFTVIHMGAAGTTLALSGRVEATVVSTGERLSIASGTQLVGGLFLQDVPGSARIDPKLDGPERLALDPVRSTVPAADLRRVTLSPWTRATEVTRD